MRGRGVGVAVGAWVPAPIGIRTPPGPIPICSEPRWPDAPVAPRVPAEESRTRGPGVGELLSRFLVTSLFGFSRFGGERRS